MSRLRRYEVLKYFEDIKNLFAQNKIDKKFIAKDLKVFPPFSDMRPHKIGAILSKMIEHELVKNDKRIKSGSNYINIYVLLKV